MSNDSFGEVTTNALVPSGEINGKEKLSFAKYVLASLMFVFILASLSYLLVPNEGKIIFELTSHIVPPIVTLVLGYYFGKS